MKAIISLIASIPRILDLMEGIIKAIGIVFDKIKLKKTKKKLDEATDGTKPREERQRDLDDLNDMFK